MKRHKQIRFLLPVVALSLGILVAMTLLRRHAARTPPSSWNGRTGSSTPTATVRDQVFVHLEGQNYNTTPNVVPVPQPTNQRASPTCDTSESERQALDKASRLLAQGSKDEALRLYESLVLTATNQANVEKALSKVFIINRDAGTLESEILKREAQHRSAPEDIRRMQILACLYQYSGDTDKEILLRESITKKTSNIIELTRLAALYEATGRSNDQARVYGRLAEANPSIGATALLKKARIEAEIGHSAEARLTCLSVLSETNVSGRVRAQAAAILGLSGEDQQALDILDECVRNASAPVDRELYMLEVYRVKIRHGVRNAEVTTSLSNLAANAVLQGVRIGARELLKKTKE